MDSLVHLENCSATEFIISYVESVLQPEDRQKATGEFSRLCGAFTVIGASDTEAKVIWSVLASILHLGAAGAVRGIMPSLFVD